MMEYLLAASLDRIAVGILLLDRKQKLLHANQTGRLYCAGDGLRLGHGGRLSATNPKDRRALHACLSGIFEVAEAPDMALSVARAEGKPLSLLISRIEVNRSPYIPAETAVLILIKAPEDRPRHAGRLLAGHYGFTAAEIRLLEALTEGKSLTDYAADANVSVNTVKVQLRALLAKTETGRQSELLLWLSTQAASFSAPNGSPPRSAPETA